MKGYLVSIGYMGWIPALRRYLLFATEVDYEEFFDAMEQQDTI